MTGKIKRSALATYLNTGTIANPVWSRVGPGVTSGKIDLKPEITTETYIDQDTASKSIDSYAPEMPVEMTAIEDDPVFEFVDALRIARAVLGDAETEVCNVWKYKTPALGFYPAEKQAVAIPLDDVGGDGGKPSKMNFTLAYIGDKVNGMFNPTPTAEFAAVPILAQLATMVIGSVTLAPVFATDKTWLYYAGSVTNATTTVTMTSTCPGATSVVQKVGVTTVAQGDPASLSVGVNHLTITVTYGTEVVIYHIDITRAAS